MYENLSQSQLDLEARLQLEGAAVRGALEFGLSVSTNQDVSEIFSWLQENSAVGYSYTDEQGQPRLIRPLKDTNGLTLHFIDDRDATLRWYPEMRELPRYLDNLHTIALPDETKSSTVLLAAVLLHEGVHARDLTSPEHTAKAASIFPAIEPDKAAELLTEVNAFTLEGLFLDDALGPEFAAYMQQEADAADRKAIEDQKENRGLLLQLGIENAQMFKVVAGLVSFTDERAKQFHLDIIGMGIVMNTAFKAIDQIGDRNNISEADRIEFKVSTLGDEYLGVM